MADINSLAATSRDLAGKGPARATRRAGNVPGVIYGNNETPVMVNVASKALEQELHSPGFFTRLIDVELGGDKHRVLPREVQFHPVTDVPMHVDFLRFSADRQVTVAVPVSFENEDESPGLKRGGVLNIVRHEVEVSCTADRIPPIFTVDLSGYDIGDAIHASAISLPDEVIFTITDRDFTVATVAAPTVIAEEAAEEAAAEGEEDIEGVEGAEGAEGAEGEGEEKPDGETADGSKE